ncbi:MAG: hypothetical protein H6581_08300 [Bacteroidia bacterium]|nr:hypothetical protein [Bacteroidia bacterium]
MTIASWLQTIASVLFGIGLIFKLLFWPFANELMIFSILLGIVGMVWIPFSKKGIKKGDLQDSDEEDSFQDGQF